MDGQRRPAYLAHLDSDVYFHQNCSVIDKNIRVKQWTDGKTDLPNSMKILGENFWETAKWKQMD